MGVLTSLCVPRLISRDLKLITMEASSDFKMTQTRDHWEANTRPDQLSYPSKL